MRKIANGDLGVGNQASNDNDSLIAFLKVMQMKLKNLTLDHSGQFCHAERAGGSEVLMPQPRPTLKNPRKIIHQLDEK